MTASAVSCVQHLIEQYGRFLRTSYRFLDERLRQQFEAHLAQADVVVRGPYVTLAQDYEPASTLAALVRAGRAHPDLLRANWPFGDHPIYRHQELAFEAGRAGRSFVVTTGTGSGKTEAFLLPVLDGILRRKEQGVRGVQAILLYPMNALANDQLERLRRLLRGSGLSVSYGLYTGDSDSASQNLREEPAETERPTRAAIRRDPPDLLLTNYKQLEFLLVRPEDRVLFTPALRFLVLDELHSYRGALATEIACLIRRLRAHANRSPGDVVAIGTSATVASGAGGAEALAAFATALFGQRVLARDIIAERFVPRTPEVPLETPDPPNLSDADLMGFDPADDGAVASLTQRLTGRTAPAEGAVAERVAPLLARNAVVAVLEDVFSRPTSVSEAANALRARIAGRADRSDEELRREVEAYLLVGSVGDDQRPPRLRPKLHTFFHGVYDVWLCLNPGCRSLIPQGGGECPHCGSAARPAALCRTCGQDFVKVRLEGDGSGITVGSGDFYSDERTAFLTPRIHELAAADEETGEDDETESEGGRARHRAQRTSDDAEAKLAPVSVCLSCGRVMEPGGQCPSCNRSGVPYLAYRWPKKQPPQAGILHVCPACGDTYTKGDIVTPLRTGTASTVATIAARHLDLLAGEDRKLLLFADNRQDVAHQAGYTADRHRSFALRHVVAHEVHAAAERGLYLIELPQRLFDEYRRLGIISGRVTRPERERWLDALTYEVANEFTRHARQRASLENLGLVGVEYEFLDELPDDPTFTAAASAAGLDMNTAVQTVRAVLDVMRKNRAVGFDFFQEYVDPNRKRRYRELEAEPYSVRFPDRDRNPKGFALDRPDHIRKSRSGTILGFYQENPRAGQLTAVQKIVARVLGGDRARAEAFLQAVVPVLLKLELLQVVPNFPLAGADRSASLRILQVNPKIIRLIRPAVGYRCVACQMWAAYELPTCPTPKCSQGRLEQREVDQDNYYVRLYTDREPLRFAVAEHSAAIAGDERAARETAFKEGRLDALVCTPTLELGVDIGPLLTVILRNAPPTPANYMQRVGRAGRRLRIGFVSTFCAGGAHDRHAFENPEWLVGGSFTPPRLRLDNVKVVHRHLRSYLLALLPVQLPRLMGDLLDDIRSPTACRLEQLEGLFAAVRQEGLSLATRLGALFEDDRRAGRVARYGVDETRELVERFEAELRGILDLWWHRVRQLQDEFRQYSTVGSPLHDMKKATARQRAYREITQDPERAYALNYLATQGFLPAYQFPLDTFSLDPGVADTPTLFRPSAIAIEEFAPGNYVYANGHKLRSIRALFAGGPGRASDRPTRSDAETSGRLRSFRFCERCDEITEEPRNACARCESPLPPAVDCVFVDAFEAEESLRIGSDEESRQRQYHVRRESLLAGDQSEVILYPYPFIPVEHHRLARVVVTNWGRADSKTGDAKRFWLCPDCGRHLPHDPHDDAHQRAVVTWRENHARLCAAEPVPLVLGYEFLSDCLVLSFPTRDDMRAIGRATLSPTAVTLAEALLAGAGDLLELEPYELAAFPRLARPGDVADEIVFYETVPGGAGYVEEMAKRLPEVAGAAQERLYRHECVRGCYLCLKHYRNQRWHPFFDKDAIRDLLAAIAAVESVAGVTARPGAGVRALRENLEARRNELAVSPPGSRRPGPQSPIEATLLEALRSVAGLPLPDMQYEVKDGDRIVTVPDFAYPGAKIAVFCDGFAFHGNQDTLELDAQKRNWLQRNGWLVLTYWGRAILKDPDACAREIAEVYRQRTRKRQG
ncbi:MAG TPA: DEAD/DEAH box helicase [Gemmatimonadales bacterium]|nr:DEAD/DEAH box helicase [Gemmatimonadales bacterium]